MTSTEFDSITKLIEASTAKLKAELQSSDGGLLECNTRNVADNAHIHLCSAKLFDALNFRRDRELNRTNWWENPYFIHQHRAALLQKDFAHYSEFYPHITAAPTSDYFWWDPIQEKFYRIIKATRKTPHHYVYYDFLPVSDSSA